MLLRGDYMGHFLRYIFWVSRTPVTFLWLQPAWHSSVGRTDELVSLQRSGVPKHIYLGLWSLTLTQKVPWQHKHPRFPGARSWGSPESIRVFRNVEVEVNGHRKVSNYKSLLILPDVIYRNVHAHTHTEGLYIFVASIFSPLLSTFQVLVRFFRSLEGLPFSFGSRRPSLCLLHLFMHMLETVPNSCFSRTSSSARQHTDQSSCMTCVHAAHVRLPGAADWETTWLPAAASAASTQLPAKTSAKPWRTRKREQTSSTFKMGFAIWQIPRESPQYETEFKKWT